MVEEQHQLQSISFQAAMPGQPVLQPIFHTLEINRLYTLSILAELYTLKLGNLVF